MSLATQIADIVAGRRLESGDAHRVAMTFQSLEAAAHREREARDVLDEFQFTYFVSTTAQAMPSGTQTAINWDLQRRRSGQPSMDWSSAESSALHTLGAVRDRSYLAWGSVEWAQNSSGFRTVVFERTDSVGGVSGDTVVQMSASTGITVSPYIVWWPYQFIEQRATLDVLQNSGGALNVTYARLNVIKVF